MKEVLPGVFHWVTFHEGIGQDVHSYYIASTDPAILIDPRVPEEGVKWFEKYKKPEHIYLTNRHHYRHSRKFTESFATQVWCHRDGLHEFTKGEQVKPFDHGDKLPGNVIALEVGVLCPEETALFIQLSGGIMAIGDAIVRYGDDLGFVPDYLMGEDPIGVKDGLRKVFLSYLDRKFDHLLFAHGKPWISGAKKGLGKFLKRLQSKAV